MRYLVRYLSSSFLLSGHVGSLISDRTVRVSVKVLALNCVGLAVMVMPSLMGEPLFIDPAAETGKIFINIFTLTCVCVLTYDMAQIQ